jgi:hypothetical protein
MFEQMLNRINPNQDVRRRSDMVLYLAANNPYITTLNGMLCYWLEELGWFEDLARNEFPFNQAIKPYSPDEIATKHAKSRRLLHMPTHGLLTLHGSLGNYYGCRVDFHHRSVRDFLRNDWKLGHAAFLTPKDKMEAFARLGIAEAQFFPEYKRHMAPFMFENFVNMISKKPGDFYEVPFRYLLQLEAIILAPAKGIPTGRGKSFQGWRGCFNGMMEFTHQDPDYLYRLKATNPSFLHWVAYMGQSAYVQQRFTAGMSLDKVDTPWLSLLLSASLGRNVELVHYLLSLGARPTDLVGIRKHGIDEKPDGDNEDRGGGKADEEDTSVGDDNDDSRKSGGKAEGKAESDSDESDWSIREYGSPDSNISIWLVILREYAALLSLSRGDFQTLNRAAKVLEALLEAGADSGVVFLVSFGNLKREGSDRREAYATLPQFLEILKPPNHANLLRLLGDRLIALPPPHNARQPATLADLRRRDWDGYGWVEQGVVSKSCGSLVGGFTFQIF